MVLVVIPLLDAMEYGSDDSSSQRCDWKKDTPICVVYYCVCVCVSVWVTAAVRFSSPIFTILQLHYDVCARTRAKTESETWHEHERQVLFALFIDIIVCHVTVYGKVPDTDGNIICCLSNSYEREYPTSQTT